MFKSDFLKAGHTPTLLAAFLYFDLAFMVWVMLGPLGVQIAADLNLTHTQKGLMVATPVLAGALLRLVMGVLVDHLKPKKAGAIGQIIVIVALFVAWQHGIHSYEQALLLGLFLGVAGASFAAALPLASRWYPPQHQGTAMGIAGAGNSGTALAALIAPSLAIAYGWSNVFGLALIPLILVFVLYLVMAKDAPECPAPKSLTEYFTILKDKDAWWFMFFYSVTFGGFVGLASSLTIYFNTQYGLALAGFVAAMLCLGMGNGAVFQLVPQRFRKEIGVMTGLVGMAGGVGGFYLASSLGYSKQATGSYQAGFLIFAALAVFALIGLTGVKNRWRTTWGASHLTAAKI